MALRIGLRVFAPHPFVALAALALVAVFLVLGFWQLDRMREKQALFAAFEAGSTRLERLSDIEPERVERYTRVLAVGRYDSAHQFLLDNMTHAGRAGYRVLTPFDLTDGGTVLVDRGWVPLGATRETLPKIEVAGSARSVVGRLDELPAAGVDLPVATPAGGWPRVLSYPHHAQLQSSLGRDLPKRIILLDAAQPDGFVRTWQPATFPPARHLSYAITWFALAATVALLFFALNMRRAPGPA
ncbi:MAG TPA: SURF1 family protein [Steroidobacteraceae bacterium]|nr:SURF1 family protein [Steroidobacteraceae bacterium]